jgi:hypothetical protein
MPIWTIKYWGTIHKWDSNDWEKDGEWTDEKMIEELVELNIFMKKELGQVFGQKYSLERLVNAIINDGYVKVKNTKLEYTKYDFTNLKNLFNDWKHFTTTCKHYGREWLAQDESRLVCFLGRNCNSHNSGCPDFEPMIKGTPLDKLIKNNLKTTFVFR